MFVVHQLQLRQERLVLDTETYLDRQLIRHMQVAEPEPRIAALCRRCRHRTQRRGHHDARRRRSVGGQSSWQPGLRAGRWSCDRHRRRGLGRQPEPAASNASRIGSGSRLDTQPLGRPVCGHLSSADLARAQLSSIWERVTDPRQRSAVIIVPAPTRTPSSRWG